MRLLEDLPGVTITKPAVVFKPHIAKNRLVAYNEAKALELSLRNRELIALSLLYLSKDDNIFVVPRLVGRHKLNLKSKSVEKAIRATRHDE